MIKKKRYFVKSGWINKHTRIYKVLVERAENYDFELCMSYINQAYKNEKKRDLDYYRWFFSASFKHNKEDLYIKEYEILKSSSISVSSNEYSEKLLFVDIFFQNKERIERSKKFFESNFSHLFEIFSFSQNYEKCFEIFETMKQNSLYISPNLHLKLLNLLAEKKDSLLIDKFILNFQSFEAPFLFYFANAYCIAGDITKSLFYFSKIEQDFSLSYSQFSFYFGSLIDFYSQKNDLQQINFWKNKILDYQVVNSEIANKILDFYKKNGNKEEAIQFFERIQEIPEFYLNDFSFSCIFELIDKQDLQLFQKVFTLLVKSGVENYQDFLISSLIPHYQNEPTKILIHKTLNEMEFTNPIQTSDIIKLLNYQKTPIQLD